MRARGLLSLLLLGLVAAGAARAELLSRPDFERPGEWTLRLAPPPAVAPAAGPVVIFLPGCEGWGPWERTAAERHAAVLATIGWRLAALDLLGPRGLESICTSNANLEGLRDDGVRAATQAAEALVAAGLADPARLVFMGQSFGGSVALDIASPQRRKLAGAGRVFAATVPYYPWCYDRYGMGTVADFDTPVLVLGGALDGWTPVERCLTLAEAQAGRADASPFLVEVYPGAYHSFDLDGMPRYEIQGFNGPQIVEGNAAAAEASRQRYAGWLGQLP